MSDDSKIDKDVDALEALSELMPLYQGAIQPGAKQVGDALEKVVTAALMPVKGLVWGFEQFKDTFIPLMARKLQKRKPSNIVPADLCIAGPTIELLKFVGHKEELRDTCANLLVTSIDAETAENAHPAFVQIIRQITPDELKIITRMMHIPVVAVIDLEAEKFGSWEIPKQQIIEIQIKDEPITLLMTAGTDANDPATVTRSRRNISMLSDLAGCEHKKLVPNYIDNLVRLGIIEKPPNAHLSSEGGEDMYNIIREYHKLEQWKKEEKVRIGQTYVENKRLIRLSELGYQFAKACISKD